eukprot:CAMPEP_0170459588 /NCGR_PEP_ID=MMETSP0123-20130129/6225_1 /TAXON_ID=182087 /ORGANISM="Favella ehrenbergii, Strain Fehren 1" /LENGTH=48 /DNA_ID= /DNA_START= /DNA_END= /DNA_ORIENTATION=
MAAEKCKDINLSLGKAVTFLDGDFKTKKEIAFEWGSDIADFTTEVWQD